MGKDGWMKDELDDEIKGDIDHEIRVRRENERILYPSVGPVI